MNDKHILLVEDDETLQALIEKLLINNDYIVSKAVNIEEAISSLMMLVAFAPYRFMDFPAKPIQDSMPGSGIKSATKK